MLHEEQRLAPQRSQPLPHAICPHLRAVVAAYMFRNPWRNLRLLLSKQSRHHSASIHHKQLAAAQGSSLSPSTKNGSISLYSRIFTVASLGALPCAIARNACSDCATIARARSFLWIEWYLDGMAQCRSGMTYPRTPGVLELPRMTPGRYSPRKSN